MPLNWLCCMLQSRCIQELMYLGLQFYVLQHLCCRLMCMIGSVGWHLPPLATVTLEQIVPPGGWTAYDRPVARKLHVVSVAFRC